MTDQLIVSTEWLYTHLEDPNLRIIDIRGHVRPASEPLPHYFAHREAYDTSHIPGAIFVDWVLDITNPDSPKAAQIATPEAFTALMARIGISNDTFVVAYDDADGMFAARMWWALNYYGHTKVAVLNGGWQKWVAENRPVTDQIPQVVAGQFIPYPDSKIRRTITEVERTLRDHTPLIDVRTPAEFKGEASRAARKGHIPGAMNIPRGTLVNTDGTIPDAETLRTKFSNAGLEPNENEVITYCNGGVSASYGMLALRLAGFKNVAVYDGSWKEWGNDDSKPIEQ